MMMMMVMLVVVVMMMVVVMMVMVMVAVMMVGTLFVFVALMGRAWILWIVFLYAICIISSSLSVLVFDEWHWRIVVWIKLFSVWTRSPRRHDIDGCSMCH